MELKRQPFDAPRLKRKNVICMRRPEWIKVPGATLRKNAETVETLVNHCFLLVFWVLL
jgi:hypothetical protein